MLKFIVQLSLRYKWTVVIAALLVLSYGLYRTYKVKLDVFPEFAPPIVTVQTEAPELSSLEVEQLVTIPIETALAGSPEMDSIRSQSIQGLSYIIVTFKEQADIFRARQVVAERLAEISGKLPQGVDAPKMGPLVGSTCSILSIGLTSTNRNLMEMRTYAEWTLRPYLMSIPGVAKVDIFGGDVQELQIKVNPDMLLKYKVSLNDIINSANQATVIRGAGFIESKNQRMIIRMEGQAVTPEQMASVPIVLPDGKRLLLKDVADVEWGVEPKAGDGLINGEKGVILLISSQLGANTLEVTANVENALKSISNQITSMGIELHKRLFRPANFIEYALNGIRHSLSSSAILVAIVLLLFLLKLRTALISFIAIPLSLLSAVIVLDYFNITINTFTLGGFAIAIGVVVDDAIIDVENIIRRLRENQNLKSPRPWFDVILDASVEVRHAIVFATIIVGIVFLPVLAMGGVQGRLFAPLGISFILATIASLVVALTVTPALCLLMLKGSKVLNEPFYIHIVKRLHNKILSALMPYHWFILLIILVITVGSLATMKYFGGEFLPEFREGHYYVHMSTVPGTSLEEELRLGKLVTEELQKIHGIRDVSQQAGRAEMGEDPFGPHYSEIHVDLTPCTGEEEEAIVQKMRESLSKIPGVSFKILPYLVERMGEVLSGATAEFVVNVYGEDLDTIEQKGMDIQNVISTIPGAVDIQSEISPSVPELLIRLKPEKLTYWNFTPGEVLETVSACFRGSVAGEIYNQTRVIDVLVILKESDRKNINTIKSLPIRNSNGVSVPLEELADIRYESGRFCITHEAAKRLVQITCNVEGRDIVSFSNEAKEKIAKSVPLPIGVHIIYSGSAEARAETQQELIVNSSVAGIIIVLLLGMVFKKFQNLILVLLNLPFALVGGVLAVFFTGGILSIGTLVGFVTLFGLSTRNSIMLMSHYDHLVKVEGAQLNIETVIRGATERFVPVTMTALVTALALLPLAIGTGEAGREIEGPMAVVILGGLLTSTILTLLILPVLVHRFGKLEK